MASDVVEKIKAAEEKADSIISTSKEQAKQLLSEAGQQSTERRKAFEKKLREDAGAALKASEEKAAKLTEAAKVNAAEQCSRLESTLVSKKDKAVELVINAVLG